MKFQVQTDKLIFALFTTMLFSQCIVTPDIIPLSEDPTSPQFEGICFETEILPIFVSRCGGPGCHNETDKEDDIILTNYVGIRKELKPGDPRNSEVIEYMYETGEDAMPPSPQDPVPTEQIKRIEKWIADGAWNTTGCEPTGPCDPGSSVSFNSNVLPVIDKYCFGCHNDADPQGGYSYSTYETTMKSVNDGTLLGSIRFENNFVAMPYKTNKMPNCDIEIIVAWVDQGVKNN